MKFIRTETIYHTKDNLFCAYISHKQATVKWNLIILSGQKNNKQNKIHYQIATWFKKENKGSLPLLHYKFYTKKEMMSFLKGMYQQLNLNPKDSELQLISTAWRETKTKIELKHFLKKGVWQRTDSDKEYLTRKNAITSANSIYPKKPTDNSLIPVNLFVQLILELQESL